MYDLIQSSKINNVHICNKGLYFYEINDNGLSKQKNESKLYREAQTSKLYMDYVQSKYPSIYALSVRRYLRIISLLVIYCNSPKDYRKDFIEAKKLTKYIKKLPEFPYISNFAIAFKIKYVLLSRCVFRYKYKLR